MLNQLNVSLWGDEGFSAILSMKSIPEIIKISANDTYPPLYNLTEHLIFKFFGTSEVAIRGLSFFYYLIAVFFTYLIGRHLFNKKTGLLAALLTFLNPFFFIYAFEGRMYSILAAGVTASMYFFLKKAWLPYVLATTLAMYSHHFAAFALAVQALWSIYELFTHQRSVFPKRLKAFIVVSLLYLPWIIPLYHQVTRVGGGFWLTTPNIQDLSNLIFDYLARGNHEILALPALIFAITLILLRRWDKKLEKSAFLTAWFLIPIIIVWTISQFFQSIFFNRYLIATIPAAMLLLASNSRKFSRTLQIILVGIFAFISWHYFTHPTKPPFRDLASYVKESRRGDDFIINGNPGNHKLWESKYYDIFAPIYVPGGNELPFFVGTALMEEGDIINELPQPRRNNPFRIGVINLADIEDPAITGYTQGEVQTFDSLKFSWYEKTYQ
jgi:mannosyltransferase